MSEVGQLKLDEDFRANLYKCTAEKWTIGYGLNLQAGITQEEAEAILIIRVRMIGEVLDAKLKWLSYAPDEVRNVLINMAYQMGLTGLLGFKRTLSHLRKEEYIEASIEMMDSVWAVKTRPRALRQSARIYDLRK